MDFSRECDPRTCNPLYWDSADYTQHGAGCSKVLHEVRQYVKPVTLVITARHPEGEMPTKWRREGWTFQRDGRGGFRWKMLCRNCIEKEAEREMVHRDYVKACKKARGVDDRTYGQLMMQQAR